MARTTGQSAGAGSGAKIHSAFRRRWWRKTRPGRLQTSLVALSSAAIVSVYGVGYLNTQTADDQLVGSTTVASVVTQTAGGAQVQQAQTGSSTPARTNVAAPTSTPTQVSGGQGQTQPVVAYRDGTYVGFGTSRHGGMEATVVIKDGRIVSALVSNCATRYPCSKISALPGKVVALQGPPVDYVSGATDSSRAYKQAVTSALAQAEGS